MLAVNRGVVVASAGHGKTELLSRFVAHEEAGRQLVLTHTHAGVAAITDRLRELDVPKTKFRVDTIAGWCLRLALAYPLVSGVDQEPADDSAWDDIYSGALKVCQAALGALIVRSSYAGVVVDEYQDCSAGQHAVVLALDNLLPCRTVGDPLQGVFKFRGDGIPWSTVESDFGALPPLLETPWRWRKSGANDDIGEWLVSVRDQLNGSNQLVIAEEAPVEWVEHDTGNYADAWSKVHRGLTWPPYESGVWITRWPRTCVAIAKRLGGKWPVVERFDPPGLRELAHTLSAASGAAAVKPLVDFLAERMTGIGPDLKTIVDALTAGRSIGRIRNFREHAELLAAVASDPTPKHALAWLEAVLAHRGSKWFLYRRDSVYQLRDALRHIQEGDFAELPASVSAVITRARYRGRRPYPRSIGTPLLVKGLEFDHAVVLWEPDGFDAEGAYVALSRASKSVTVVSPSRTLTIDSR